MTASNAFINALGNIGSFGLNFAGGTSVSKTNEINKYMSYLWRKNYKWSNLNGYSYMRQGLENAGYNPLLAIGASPQQGYGSSAVAAGDTVGINADIASGKQANVARDMAGSQIDLNNANAFRAYEEALSETNKRANLDADTSLKQATEERIWNLLPYETREKLAIIIAKRAEAELNVATAKAVPRHASAHEKEANAAEKTANTNATWTPVGVGSGIAAGLIGYGIGKAKNFFKRPVGFR